MKTRGILLYAAVAATSLWGVWGCATGAPHHAGHGDHAPHGEMAHHGEHAHHGDGGPGAVFATEAGGYRYQLTARPEQAVARAESELEVDVLRLDPEDDILGGDPVQGATIAFRYRRADGQGVAENYAAHAEPSPGVYGHHYTFPAAGDWVVEVRGSTLDGTPLAADFAISVR